MYEGHDTGTSHMIIQNKPLNTIICEKTSHWFLEKVDQEYFNNPKIFIVGINQLSNHTNKTRYCTNSDTVCATNVPSYLCRAAFVVGF